MTSSEGWACSYMTCSEADTADQLWCSVAEQFRSRKGVSLQPGRGGPTLEILNAWLTVRDPRRRWIVSRLPAVNLAFAIVEVIWILRGRNDARFLNHWFRGLPRWAGSGETYYGAY